MPILTADEIIIVFTRRSFSAGVGDGERVKSPDASVNVASASGGPCSLPCLQYSGHDDRH